MSARESLPIEDTTGQQHAAVAVLNELHRAGFTRCWMESVLMFSGGVKDGKLPHEQIQYHHLRVVIDEENIYSEPLQSVLEIAERCNATVALTELRLNGQTFSRIALWPKAGSEA